MTEFEKICEEARACKICEPHLPFGANPVFAAGENAKILVVGQAPGAKVHQTGIPWNDKSGEELRNWLGISDAEFYDTDLFSILPIGFCYPGKAKTGDLPPRKECAPTWQKRFTSHMPNLELILLIGQYAQKYYLKEYGYQTLTHAVKNHLDYHPEFFPLPHPSPRNFVWMGRNPWFKTDVLPFLKQRVHAILYDK